MHSDCEYAMRESHLGALRPDRRNARRHTPRNIGMIERSLEADGFGRSILLDAAGNIIAGNGVTEAAGHVGLEDVIVVPSDGRKVIAVQRTDVEPGSERAIRLAIADNRAQELSEFDPVVLASIAEDIDMSDFWREDEIAKILRDADVAIDAPTHKPQTFAVVVECRDESDQASLIERLDAEGYTVRPMGT